VFPRVDLLGETALVLTAGTTCHVVGMRQALKRNADVESADRFDPGVRSPPLSSRAASKHLL
jgi:hypothetical protein